MIRKTLFLALLCVSSFLGLQAQTQLTDLPDNTFNFIIANDLGRNGYYEQKPIAELMGTLAEKVDIEFVAAVGDIHHFEGVASVNDPLWMTNFELVYSHPELMIDWFPVMGNHEYRGNTQAVLDYTKVSRRWSMPARYYVQYYQTEGGKTIKIVYIDTVPLINKYRDDKKSYPDAALQNREEQLAWIDKTLSEKKADWTIVLGHHPIYGQTPKDEEERTTLQKLLDPILRKHKVDLYVGGHIHNFQHIRVKGSDIDYVVNSSASLSRKVKPIEGTQFCSPVEGFSVCSVSDNELKLYMINAKGEIIYTIERKK